MEIGTKIKALREQRGMTVAELAKELGVSQSTLKEWEANRREPRIRFLIKIVKLYGVKLSYLLGV